MNEIKKRAWRCTVCGYVHHGGQPPDECPICGVTKSYFEEITVQEPSAPTVGATDGAFSGRLAVLGAGIAGISAVEAFRRASPEAPLVLISKEDALPYYRLNLTRYLAGQMSEAELPIHDRDWYESRNIELRLNTEVAEIDLAESRLVMRDGAAVRFDRLIVTSGAHPFVPPLPGAHREGVTPLRTIADARRILEQLKPGMRCAIVGGGLLGLEAAGALSARGCEATVLEGGQWLMPRQLNRRAGEILLARLEGLGIRVAMNARTRELVGDERVMGVLLDDGRLIPADLVVIATGVRPNSHLARRAGLEVKTGIVVDDRLRSSHPAVYAAGDVAEHRGVLYGSWAACQYQGGIAGLNAAGGSVDFGGIPRSNSLKVLGLDLVSIGAFEPEGPDALALETESEGSYLRFVFRSGRIAGAVMLGGESLAGAVKVAMEAGRDFSEMLAAGASAKDVADSLRSA